MDAIRHIPSFLVSKAGLEVTHSLDQAVVERQLLRSDISEERRRALEEVHAFFDATKTRSVPVLTADAKAALYRRFERIPGDLESALKSVGSAVGHKGPVEFGERFAAFDYLRERAPAEQILALLEAKNDPAGMVTRAALDRLLDPAADLEKLAPLIRALGDEALPVSSLRDRLGALAHGRPDAGYWQSQAMPPGHLPHLEPLVPALERVLATAIARDRTAGYSDGVAQDAVQALAAIGGARALDKLVAEFPWVNMGDRMFPTLALALSTSMASKGQLGLAYHLVMRVAEFVNDRSKAWDGGLDTNLPHLVRALEVAAERGSPACQAEVRTILDQLSQGSSQYTTESGGTGSWSTKVGGLETRQRVIPDERAYVALARAYAAAGDDVKAAIYARAGLEKGFGSYGYQVDEAVTGALKVLRALRAEITPAERAGLAKHLQTRASKATSIYPEEREAYARLVREAGHVAVPDVDGRAAHYLRRGA